MKQRVTELTRCWGGEQRNGSFGGGRERYVIWHFGASIRHLCIGFLSQRKEGGRRGQGREKLF